MNHLDDNQMKFTLPKILRIVVFILFSAFCFVNNGYSKKWQVGPTKTYIKPSAVASLVSNGDTVEIDTGLYSGDVANWNKNNLVLRGTGKYAHLDANGMSSGGKAIWVISGNKVLVENIEFSGCTVVDNNGAGIRIEGNGLTVRNCYFHNNENGMLGGSAGSVVVEFSEFAYNGYGDGYSHNIYINHVDSFTLRYCYMHHAKIGHEVKSRAHRNYILYNRITNEASGTASRNIDLPNGGLAIVMGNLVEQGSNTQNSNMLGYGLEGLTNNPPHQLYVVNNTFVNERSGPAIFISIPAATELLKVYNNIFTGQPYTFLSGSAVSMDTLSNLLIPDKTKAGFVNLSTFDYHLTGSSPAINKGSNAGLAGTFSLLPVAEYVHPKSFTTRSSSGTIDAGAYEFYSTGTENIRSPVIKIRYEDYAADKKALIVVPAGINVSSILVYDLSGRQATKPIKIAENSWEWNYTGILPGIYLLKFVCDSRIEGMKVMVH